MRTVALENPVVFCALLAKVLPLSIADEKTADVPRITKINLVPMAPKQFAEDEPKELVK